MLRRRIQELQHYRRLGLTSSADIEKYENELYHRVRSQFDSTPTFEVLTVTVNRMPRKRTQTYNATNRRIDLLIFTDKVHVHPSLRMSWAMATSKEDEVEIRSHQNLVPRGASQVCLYSSAYFKPYFSHL
jgi:hypothetical protein